ncbi:MAG: hypothetical protein K2L26_04875 [Duncaniella sp.]|nr:hypothetical protein [Duncaniella sp.]
MKILQSILSLLLVPAASLAGDITPQEISVAGFFPIENSGRLVYDFNNGWRFHLGDVAAGEAVGLDDSSWEVVSTPHTMELLPAEGSGCRN